MVAALDEILDHHAFMGFLDTVPPQVKPCPEISLLAYDLLTSLDNTRLRPEVRRYTRRRLHGIVALHLVLWVRSPLPTKPRLFMELCALIQKKFDLDIGTVSDLVKQAYDKLVSDALAYKKDVETTQ